MYALGQKDCQNQHLTTHQEQQDHVIRKNLKFMHAPILTATLCLNSCATARSNAWPGCPVYPVAGPETAKELEKADYASFPHTWEWIGRINKLRQELELCPSKSKY